MNVRGEVALNSICGKADNGEVMQVIDDFLEKHARSCTTILNVDRLARKLRGRMSEEGIHLSRRKLAILVLARAIHHYPAMRW